MDEIPGISDTVPGPFQTSIMSDNKQEFTPSQPCQNTGGNAPAEHPLPQNSDHNAPVVIQPYAIEEPEDDPPPVSCRPTITFIPEPSPESWHAELVDSMQGLRCEGDIDIARRISRYNRGKKRKPSSTGLESSQVSQKYGPGTPQVQAAEDGRNLKPRKLRRKTKQSNEAMGTPTNSLSDVGFSEFESSESFGSRSPSLEENGTDSNPETSATLESMDLD